MWPEKIICLSNFFSILFKISISGDLEPRRARPIPVGVLVAGDVAISKVGNLRWFLHFLGTFQEFSNRINAVFFWVDQRGSVSVRSKCLVFLNLLSRTIIWKSNGQLIEHQIKCTLWILNTLSNEHFWTYRFMPKKSAEPDIIVSSSSVKDGSLWDGGFQFEANLIGSEVLATLETRTILAKWMIWVI